MVIREPATVWTQSYGTIMIIRTPQSAHAAETATMKIMGVWVILPLMEVRAKHVQPWAKGKTGTLRGLAMHPDRRDRRSIARRKMLSFHGRIPP